MSLSDIWRQFVLDMHNTGPLEYIAVVTGILSVWFSRIENIWVYPTGLISTIIYIFVSYEGGLLGEASVNLYYTVMSVYGWILWARRNEAQGARLANYQFVRKGLGLATWILWNFLLHSIFCANLSKAGFVSICHSMGRRICFSHGLYRHVADDKEKSRKLVLVDRHQHCFHSIVLCQALCIYQRLLYYPVRDGNISD